MNEIVLPLDLDLLLPSFFTLVGWDEFQIIGYGIVALYFIGYFVLLLAEHKA